MFRESTVFGLNLDIALFKISWVGFVSNEYSHVWFSFASFMGLLMGQILKFAMGLHACQSASERKTYVRFSWPRLL